MHPGIPTVIIIADPIIWLQIGLAITTHINNIHDLNPEYKTLKSRAGQGASNYSLFPINKLVKSVALIKLSHNTRHIADVKNKKRTNSVSF